MTGKLVASLENAIFGHRRWVIAISASLTLFLGWAFTGLRPDAGFHKLLPLKHEYIRTFIQYQDEFGGANRLLIAVHAVEGDIFTPEFFQRLRQVTDAVFFLPGVNRSTVQSIFTPNVRFIEIVEGGFTGGNVVPADFQPTPQGLHEVRENILKSGTVGRLVSGDFTAAMVSAQLVEVDPATQERLDYLQVAGLLESEIRERYSDEDIQIHILGFAKIMGDIADGATGVIAFFGIAFVVTAVLVYLFTLSWRAAMLPLICSVIAVLWNLGLIRLLGYGPDPMSLLVPFLIFAIGVSHGIQMVNALMSRVMDGTAPEAAARQAFRQLLVPGGIALLSDTVGFITIYLIGIRVFQDLAVTASLGVLAIILTNLVLLPVLLSFLKFEQARLQSMRHRVEQRQLLWKGVAQFALRRRAVVVLVFAAALGVVGMHWAREIEIGDIHEGVPELRSGSRYNQDAALITDKFNIGLDILTVIVETVPDGCVEHHIMEKIDEFQWTVANLPGVESTISLPQVSKIINAGWNEGNLKWRVLPRHAATLSQAVTPVETATGLLNSDCSVMPVMIFLQDHKAETINQVVAVAKRFAAENDSDRHRFRLAAGNAGVMAATNEVVEAAQARMLAYIYAAVAFLCLVTFRSLRAVLCILLPLSLVSILAYALMTLLQIGLKTSTLPVAALGVGIGVDYGIYIFSRMRESLNRGASLRDAYLQTLRVTGNAVLVTGLTLAIGVSTWIFSALQFQADMGTLLTFMFLANMIGALVLLPSLAAFLFPDRKARR